MRRHDTYSPELARRDEDQNDPHALCQIAAIYPLGEEVCGDDNQLITYLQRSESCLCRCAALHSGDSFFPKLEYAYGRTALANAQALTRFFKPC
jgi:hypothetical protein